MSMTEQQFRALLDRYLNGKASPKEQELLNKFFDSYRDRHDGADVISDSLKEEILENILHDTHAEIKIIPVSRTGMWLKVAATVSILATGAWFVLDRTSPVERSEEIAVIQPVAEVAGKGQKRDVELPDGTRVKLNSNSTLSYPSSFNGLTREVTLDGEAYFDVTHNPSRPFVVHTGKTSTTVLGTSFNVNTTRNSALTITLVNGKVNVATADAMQALLPNEQAVVNNGSTAIKTQKVDVSKYIAWKNNTLVFDNIKVSEALAIMENWYNVTIEVDNKALYDCNVRAKYENESLENVLNSFRFMLALDFKIEGRHVTVSGKNCKTINP